MTCEMRAGALQDAPRRAGGDGGPFPTAAELGFDREAFRRGMLSVVVLGASGDLAKKETFPALLDLWAHSYLPPQVAIVGFARTVQDSAAFRDWLRPWLRKSQAGQMRECKFVLEEFLEKVVYFPGKYDSAEDFARLSTTLGEEERRFYTASALPEVTNRVFYFAIPPFAFLAAAASIRASARSSTGFTRLIVEKPFGSDLESAKKLAGDLGRLYDEGELFRMDHFLGYEICQSVLFARFANAFVEPTLNSAHVACVRITLKEDFGTEGRGGYFTHYGIIRDVIQNHLLQMLTLIAMEKPTNIGGDIRDAKVAVLNAVQEIDPREVVLGQFTAANGKPGYLEDDSIAKGDLEKASMCATFAQLVIRINNDRWRGVPFIVRAGKGLEASKCEIRVQFKDIVADSKVFKDQRCPRNELVMRVSPDEAVYMKMNSKEPGLSMAVSQSELDLSYKTRYAGVYSPLAYTRLILAGIRGESESFVRSDELLRSWELFSPLLEKIEGGKKEVHRYPFGSRGPALADDFLAKFDFKHEKGYRWGSGPRAAGSALEACKSLSPGSTPPGQGRGSPHDPDAEHFDIIAVGSGGGSKISTPAHKLGYKVAMVEHGFDVRLPDELRAGEAHRDGLGGTCLNRGCIPSKMLIHPADVVTEIKEAARFDLTVSYEGVDLESLVSRVTAAVDKDSASINPSYDKDPNKVWFKGTAKFVGPKTLQVGDKKISADYIFLAGGAVPQVPDIPGLAETPYLTSTEALRLRRLPKRMIVIGAGYIAVELGHYFGAMGAEVHMMARSKLLRAMDGEARDEFDSVFSRRYTTHNGVTFKKVSHSAASGFVLEYADALGDKTLEAEQLLVVTGVKPTTEQLCLEATGVALREGGFVKVDSLLRTSCDGIWSFGDMAGNYLFRHCANFEAEYLMENVVCPLKETGHVPREYPSIDYAGMPYAVFSNPQVAGVGLTEEECAARGVEFVKGVNPYAKSAMGDARRSDHGFAKLLVRKGTREILGCHIVGYEASTMIHQVTPLMRMQGKLDDLLCSIFVHPALNEILRNAARKARDALVEAGDHVPVRLRLK